MTTESISILESDLMDFRSILLTAVSAAFAVDDGISDKDIRKIWRITREYDGMAGGERSLYTENWRYYRTQNEIIKALESIPETNELTNFISQRFPNSGLKIRSGSREFLLQDGLEILADLCRKRQRKDPLSAEVVVSKLIDELRVLSKKKSTKGSFEYFAVIAALDLPSGTDELQLTPKIKIRRLSKSEREEIAFNSSAGLSSYNAMDAMRFRVAITYEFEQELVLGHGNMPIGSIRPKENLHDIVDNTLKTLHLFYKGNSKVLFAEHRSVGSIIDFNSGRYGPIPDGFIRTPMLIDTNNVDRLRRVLQTVFANKNSQIKLALARLAQSTSRTELTDQLIDAVIALESLLTPSESQSEMTFRIKTYFALIGERSEFKKRFDQINTVFVTRGKIVHGGTDQHAKLAEQSNLAAAFAKEAILWCLEHPKLPNQTKIEKTFWQDYLFEHFYPPHCTPILTQTPSGYRNAAEESL